MAKRKKRKMRKSRIDRAGIAKVTEELRKEKFSTVTTAGRKIGHGKTAYFALPRQFYETPVSHRMLGWLYERGYTKVLSPAHKTIREAVMLFPDVEAFFKRIVYLFDHVYFTSLPDGYITSGVASELWWAFHLSKKVFWIHPDIDKKGTVYFRQISRYHTLVPFVLDKKQTRIRLSTEYAELLTEDIANIIEEYLSNERYRNRQIKTLKKPDFWDLAGKVSYLIQIKTQGNYEGR